MDQMMLYLQIVSVILCFVCFVVFVIDWFVLVRVVIRVWIFFFRKDFDVFGEKEYYYEFLNKMWYDFLFYKNNLKYC